MLAEVVIGPDACGPILVTMGPRVRVMHAGSVVGIQWPAGEHVRLAYLIRHGASGDSTYGTGGIGDVHLRHNRRELVLTQGPHTVVVPNGSREALVRAVMAIGRVSARRGGTPDATA